MKCPICGSKDLREYLHIKMPVILSSLPYKDAIKVPEKDLKIIFCTSCFTGLNSTPIDNSILNDIYLDYSGYISPFNNVGKSKFRDILNIITLFVPKNANITEIGCGDGYLLYLLKKEGYSNISGFEPSKLSDIGIQHNLKIFKTFFKIEELRKNNIENTNFILSHFLEHTNDPLSLMNELRDFLGCDDCIIIEVPYFDGFHHEHQFYFSKKSLMELAKRTELSLSYLNSSINNGCEVLTAVFSNINRREEEFSPEPEESSTEFEKFISSRKENLFRNLHLLEEKVKQYKNILIWGAGSSAVLYLNNIKSEVLEKKNVKIVSGDKRHEGRYIPGILKPVENPIRCESHHFDLIVILSQFYEEITKSMNNLNIRSNELIWVF